MSKITKNSKFFEIARHTAQKSTMTHKIGCVVVYKGKVLISKYNEDAFVRIRGTQFRSHAEMRALAALYKKCAQERHRIA